MPRAVITGAASGIGRELARALPKMQGVPWTILAIDKNEVGLRALADEVPEVVPLVLDLGQFSDIGPVLTEAMARLDRRSPRSRRGAPGLAPDGLELLVNAAGYAVFSTFADAELARMDALFRVNVMGLAAVTQALLPRLRRSGGTVVQLSSLSGRIALPGSGFYAATKHAVEALADALALENADAGLRVEVIQPGNVATAFQRNATAATPEVPADSPHHAAFADWDRTREHLLDEACDPVHVVQTILAALVYPSRPGTARRTRVGMDAQALLTARDALPDDRWTEWLAAAHGTPGGSVPTAKQVLAALPTDPHLSAWPGLRQAAAAGLLWRWSTTASGREALAALASPHPPPHPLDALLPRAGVGQEQA